MQITSTNPGPQAQLISASRLQSGTRDKNVARVTSKKSISKLIEKQTPDALGRRLLSIIVYSRCCRIGERLTLNDLDVTEIGDWKMPDFSTACAYTAAQGWLTVQDDGLILTTAGLASA